MKTLRSRLSPAGCIFLPEPPGGEPRAAFSIRRMVSEKRSGPLGERWFSRRTDGESECGGYAVQVLDSEGATDSGRGKNAGAPGRVKPAGAQRSTNTQRRPGWPVPDGGVATITQSHYVMRRGECK